MESEPSGSYDAGLALHIVSRGMTRRGYDSAGENLASFSFASSLLRALNTLRVRGRLDNLSLRAAILCSSYGRTLLLKCCRARRLLACCGSVRSTPNLPLVGTLFCRYARFRLLGTMGSTEAAWCARETRSNMDWEMFKDSSILSSVAEIPISLMCEGSAVK